MDVADDKKWKVFESVQQYVTCVEWVLIEAGLLISAMGKIFFFKDLVMCTKNTGEYIYFCAMIFTTMLLLCINFN